jgi:hypothetical protein
MDIHSVENVIAILEKRLDKAVDRYEMAKLDRVADIRFGAVVELQQAVLEVKDILNAELAERDFAARLEAL